MVDMTNIRSESLLLLIDEYGGQAKLAAALDVTPGYINQLKTARRGIGEKSARTIEIKLDLPEGWMDVAHDTDGTSFAPAPPNTRRIPVISYVQAGDPRPIIDDHAPGNGIDDIWVGGATAEKLGSYSFALTIKGDSMEPDFRPGDQIIVDPDVVPRPGEIVVAKIGSEEEATLKQYRARGTDENGVEIFELVPINNNHATILVNAANPGQIIGTVMHHLRNMRRG